MRTDGGYVSTVSDEWLSRWSKLSLSVLETNHGMSYACNMSLGFVMCKCWAWDGRWQWRRSSEESVHDGPPEAVKGGCGGLDRGIEGWRMDCGWLAFRHVDNQAYTRGWWWRQCWPKSRRWLDQVKASTWALGDPPFKGEWDTRRHHGEG
jgi:hypothetical protein